MKLIQTAARFLFSLYGFGVFLMLFFCLLPLFLIAFLFPRFKSANGVIFLARIWSKLFLMFTFIRVEKIFLHRPEPEKQYIFVTNHISYLDIPMMLSAISDRNIRILGKASMGKIPLFGMVYNRGAVTVDRSSPEARAASVKEMIRLLNRGVSIVVCPEGTFNTTGHPLKEFYDGAFKIAIETQTNIVPVLFPDTYDRLNYSSVFSLTPGKSRAVYLPEIRVFGMTPGHLQILKQEVYQKMEEGLIQYEGGWIANEKSLCHE